MLELKYRRIRNSGSLSGIWRVGSLGYNPVKGGAGEEREEVDSENDSCMPMHFPHRARHTASALLPYLPVLRFVLLCFPLVVLTEFSKFNLFLLSVVRSLLNKSHPSLNFSVCKKPLFPFVGGHSRALPGLQAPVG